MTQIAKHKQDNFTNAELSSYVFGQEPPHNEEIEAAFIGAILVDKDAIYRAIGIISEPEDFYIEKHKIIFEAIKNLYSKQIGIDLLTVCEELEVMSKLTTVGGAVEVSEIGNRAFMSVHIEHHGEIIKTLSTRRKGIKLASEFIPRFYDRSESVADLTTGFQSRLFRIIVGQVKDRLESIGDTASKFIKRLEEVSKKEGGLTGVPSGLTELDRLTGGWQNQDLIIIAARPGMGKTALTLALARNAAVDFERPVAIFSLEMSNVQLFQRLVSMEAEISGSKLRNGQLYDSEWQQLQAATELLSNQKIFIDDTPGIKLEELRAKAQQMKIQHNIELIIVDYLQLMRGDQGGNREQEISSISRGLKGIAKELNIPVIALSQLSRAVETRGGTKRPQLSDLRESGAIEQDADIVSFIYRPEYYQIIEDEEGQSLRGVAEVIVAKHRSGALDTVKLKFQAHYAKFSDLDDPIFDDLPQGNFTKVEGLPKPTSITSIRNNDDDIPF